MARVVHSEEINEIRGVAAKMKPGWSFESYPRVDPRLIDQRPQVVATERMLWRKDYSLACNPGETYAEEDLPLLITRAEWQAETAPKPRKK